MNFLDGKIERRGSELGVVSSGRFIPAPTIEGYHPEGESASVGILPSKLCAAGSARCWLSLAQLSSLSRWAGRRVFIS